MSRKIWEAQASWWQANFTGGADPEYEEQILPLAVRELAGAARVLDLGTGEGQLARALARQGAGVVGVDPALAQLDEARRRGGPPRYAAAEGAALPFRSASFDAVLICLVLEHVEAMEATVGEVARVLVPGGRLLLMLNHPLLQVPGSGWIDDQVLGEQYWRVGPYLVTDSSLEEVDKGVFIPFVHRPLSCYVNALAERGLLATRMEEPAPPQGFLSRAAEYSQAATIPRLMALVARKLGHNGACDG